MGCLLKGGAYCKAFETVIGLEGGYVYDKDDLGGETKYGISKRSFPNLNIMNLTLDDAKYIYKVNYWDKMHLDDLGASYNVKEELFEQSVNMGVKTSSKILQRALNVINKQGELFDDLVIDGIIGDKTKEATSLANQRLLFKTLNILQGMRYIEISESREVNEKFLAGWVDKRVIV